ncbi:MAG: hypothetical protein WBG90_18435 [Saonia sp.]
MPALKPSALLKNKSNVRPVGDRATEATAEDFVEMGQIFDDHADRIDALTGGGDANPNYGVFTSLLLLQAAYPAGEDGAYAVIDAGIGTDARIALWDTTDNDWVLQETTSTTTTTKIVVTGDVTNVEVTDVNGDPHLIVSGTYEGPDPTKLESYSVNSITREL